METIEVQEPGKRTLLKPVAGGVVVLVLAVGGFLYWQHTSGRETTDDAQIDGRIHQVSARVGGPLVKVNAHENQVVQAGEVLAQIDRRDYEVAVEKARAELAVAEAEARSDSAQVPIVNDTSSSRLAGARAGVAEAQASLATAGTQIEEAKARQDSAQAMLRQAEANAVRASRDLERYAALLAKDEISKQQYDLAKSAADATAAQVDSSRAQARVAEQAVRVAQSQLEMQKAKVARSETDVTAAATAPRQVQSSQAKAQSSVAKLQEKQASLRQAELNLEYTTLRAPMAGIVSQKSIEVGNLVQPGQPLLAVVALEDIWVVANFKENQLAKMKVGQKVEISVDTFGGRKYKAQVDSISPATGARFSLLPAENSSGNYVKVVQRVPVKIVFEDGQLAEHVLRPGMSVVPVVDVR